MKKSIALFALLALTTSPAFAGTADFDSKDTGPNNYYKPTVAGSYGWPDGGMEFNMNVTDFSWNGFTYSDVNDITTVGFDNQYAAYGATSGIDKSGSGVYTIGYVDSFNGITPTASFNYPQTVTEVFVNNTTYAALDMINGSGFSKQFGGATGDDADWFLLTIEGFDASHATQGTVDFYLADYRFADNAQDYIIDDWTSVNLTSLGADVRSVEFTLTSSDTGGFGMNTPAYFAIDEMQSVPEPASALLILIGGLGITGYRRYKKQIGA
jgi:hypothetical protein